MPQAQPGRRTIALVAIALFVVLAAYYVYTAQRLPLGAGPDEAASYDAVAFIYRHGRLPVLPRDEQALHFTPNYGSTRALRPPLAYIAAALAARTVMGPGDDLRIAARYGSALLMAAAAALAFLAIVWYTGGLWAALFGAVATGLMPQYAFLAAYCNDDSGAIFSVTLATLALVAVVRRGLTPATAVLVGAAGGLIILAKLTAWLFLPFLGLAVLIALAGKGSAAPRYLALLVVCALVAGAWWPLFNIYHYGIDDPLQFRVTAEYAAKHGHSVAVGTHGFAEQGLGFADLVWHNYRNFVGESFKSTVGNLDWLRLRVGPWQYGFYLMFVAAAALTGGWRLLRLPAAWRGGSAARVRAGFELLLVAAVVFQCCVYVWSNLYQDAQVQGKYLLPVFAPLLLVALAGLTDLGRAIRRAAEHNGWEWVNLPQLNVFNLLAMLGIAAAVVLHWDALARYVLPFYFPSAYHLNLKHFKSLGLDDAGLVARYGDLTLAIDGGAWRVTGTGRDPAIIFAPEVCALFGRNTVIRMQVEASRADIATLFIDDGHGFHDKLSSRVRFTAGRQALVFALGATRCRGLRFDPMTHPGRMTISAIAIAPLVINPTNFPR